MKNYNFLEKLGFKNNRVNKYGFLNYSKPQEKNVKYGFYNNDFGYTIEIDIHPVTNLISIHNGMTYDDYEQYFRGIIKTQKDFKLVLKLIGIIK